MSTIRKLSWPRAYGKPLLSVRIRSMPADFDVTEELGFEPEGSGEHDFLCIEKTGANTVWVARQLARHAGVRVADVGFAGLKDRHAVTRQWFSVPRRGNADTWTEFDCDGVTLLRHARHTRKLRRGTHRGNRFRIALRGEFEGDVQQRVTRRLEDIAGNGVPNYFGEQRFGRDGFNLVLAERLFAGERMRRDKQSLAVSAARSYLFNEILAVRVNAGNWHRILPGELANLHGSGSVFAVERLDAELRQRCRVMDIHPTAPLYGTGLGPAGDVATLEETVLAVHTEFTKGLDSLGAKRTQRPLRLKVQDLQWQFEPDVLWLDFTLLSGGFATSVLREIADCRNAPASRPAPN